MSVQSLGIQLAAWYNGEVRQVALCRPRTKKGCFLPFESKNEYPAVLVDNQSEIGVVRQDSDNKLYFIRN